MKHIVLTGGGTAGHVTPNIAMIPALKEQGFKISYIEKRKRKYCWYKSKSASEISKKYI